MQSKQTEYRRFLVPIDTVSTEQLFTDCVIVGAGIAGLRAAIETAASEPRQLRVMGDRARHLAENSYSRDSVVSSMAELLRLEPPIIDG
jgi:hypothetical protein